MKTKETTEEVSSHPGEKGLEAQKRMETLPALKRNPRRTEEKGLQTHGNRAESRKMPTLIMGGN